MTTTTVKKGYPYGGSVKFAVRLSGDKVSWFDDYTKALSSAAVHGSNIEVVDARGYCFDVRPRVAQKDDAGRWIFPKWEGSLPESDVEN
jgi:hypothetical protein